jgi:tetratricopeptide (TPR) repeat protein
MGARPPGPAPRRPTAWPDEGRLPQWVERELARVTPEDRVEDATAALTRAGIAFAESRHEEALSAAEQAKRLSSRDATTRELMGLAAYRLGRWDVALRELRTYRRLSGDTTHMAVEMDVLRALDRPHDVEETWVQMQRHGGDPDAMDEGRVVFGSFLLDRGEARRAWEVVEPGRLIDEPSEARTRVWFVAARAAHALGDRATARKIYQALEALDIAMPGLDALDSLTG